MHGANIRLKPIMTDPIALQPRTLGMLAIIGAALLAVSTYLSIAGNPPYIDEGMMHMPQIEQYRLALESTEALSSISTSNQIVTMVPGYHWMIAGILKITHLPTTLDTVRGVSLCLSLLTMLAILWAARAALPDRYWVRTWHIMMLPMCFPFMPLVYSDIPSLFFIALAFGFYFRKSLLMAGLMMCLSLGFRQTHLFWLGLLFAMIYVDTFGYTLSVRNAAKHCRQHAVFIVGVIGFALFVYWNHGVAMGQYRNQHTTQSLFMGNLFFFLQAFAFIFMPWLLYHFHKNRLLFKTARYWIMAVGLVGLYSVLPHIEHPWNIFEPQFLRNQILWALMFNPWWMLVGMCLLIMGTTAYLAWPMIRPSAKLLAPFTALALLPITLIEPRYYLPVFMLFLLFSAPRPRWQEYALAVWLALQSGFVLVGHLNGWFFL